MFVNIIKLKGIHMDWDWLLNFAAFVRDLGIGIGAIFGGKVILPDWWRETKKRLYRNYWRKRFPRSKLRVEDGFDLVRLNPESPSDKVYIIDKMAQTKYWIKNAETFLDMGFAFDDQDVQAIAKKELDKYPDGSPINFLDDLAGRHISEPQDH